PGDAARFRPYLMAVVEATDAEHAIAASMREDRLQLRQAVEDAAEDERGERHRGLERIADEIAQMVLLQPGIGAATAGMVIDDGAEAGGRLKHREEGRIVPVRAVDMRAHHDAAETEIAHAALELGDGAGRVLQGQEAKA